MNFKTWAIGIVLLAFALRLYRVTNPVADWHSFRQADTASVTREYVKHGIDLLHPRYHDLSNIQSGEDNGGKDNVEGWRMVEFPIINGLLALFMRTFQIHDVVMVSRLASILASLGTLSLLMFVTKKLYDTQIALITGLAFAILPYSVYYSRVILPEPFLLTATLASLTLYWVSLEKKSKLFLLSSASFFAIALLIKPMAIFFVPAFIGLRLQKNIRITRMDFYSVLGFGLSLIPLLLWRQWIQAFPLGIPSSNWLFNGGGEGKRLSPVYNIRFRPAWFRWLFYERLTRLFLGFTGVIPFVVGILPTKIAKKINTKDLFVWLFGLGMGLYLIVFAAGNVQHDYYQILLVPFVSLALGIGITRLFRSELIFIQIGTVAIVAISLWFSWQQVGGYYHINHPDIILAGKKTDELLPDDAKIIAPFGGDTAFLFQTNRTGWPIGFEIDEKISEGATHYVSVNYDDEARELEKRYTTVEKTDKYIILNLAQHK